jgi:hypothetical protein
MSAALLLPQQTAVEEPPRKRFTREEVDRLSELGFFDGCRYELIDGDLIDKMGQNPPHARATQLVLTWLAGVFGTQCIRVQLPLEASPADQKRSLPEPDLAVLAQTSPNTANGTPAATNCCWQLK